MLFLLLELLYNTLSHEPAVFERLDLIVDFGLKSSIIIKVELLLELEFGKAQVEVSRAATAEIGRDQAEVDIGRYWLA